MPKASTTTELSTSSIVKPATLVRACEKVFIVLAGGQFGHRSAAARLHGDRAPDPARVADRQRRKSARVEARGGEYDGARGSLGRVPDRVGALEGAADLECVG